MRTTYRFFDNTTMANPVYDVDEREDHFALSVDLPGVKKDEIKIEVLDKDLTISGERKRFDKSYGAFKHAFLLPNTVSADKIEAQYEDGVLQLYIPKTLAAQARTIQIN